MERIEAKRVTLHAKKFLEQLVYIHLEVNPGAYWRNGSAILRALHLKGDHPYRVFLELSSPTVGTSEGNSLIQVNELTHMELGDDSLILTGYDDKGRIAETIEVSLSAFPV